MRIIAFGTFLIVLFLAGIYGLLCLVGLMFIEGDYRDVEGIGDGCYYITEYHQNWYPSNNEITNEYTECAK